MKIYCVYILTNKHNTVLYVGVTSDLFRRVFDHKTKRYPKSFTAKYNCDKLIYVEEFHEILTAIHREKQLKKYRRSFKENLIKKKNPNWEDLSESWYEKESIAFSIELNRKENGLNYTSGARSGR